MTVLIRPIRTEDYQGFNQTLGVVAREKRYLAFLDAPPMEGTRSFVEGNIKNGNPQFVAEDDGKIVGWCDVCRHSRPVSLHVGTLGIGLLPDYRGKGLGRQLMQATMDAAIANGMTRIELTVREDNANAILLYKSLGFEIEGLIRKSHLVDGVYENVYLMSFLA